MLNHVYLTLYFVLKLRLLHLNKLGRMTPIQKRDKKQPLKMILDLPNL